MSSRSIGATSDRFVHSYGPWAVVAGASDGLGAAFVRAVAGCGIDVVAVARRGSLLEALKEECAERFRRTVVPLVADLAEPESFSRIIEATGGMDVGLLIYNAAFVNGGSFLDHQVELHRRIVDVNCIRPMELAHHFAGLMKAKGRGGIVLMSSLTSFIGSPYISAYGASKAFNMILAEGLWYELRRSGVDVLASCPGAITTPDFIAGYSGKAGFISPPLSTPEEVAFATLEALGRKSIVIPGRMNSILSFIMRHLLPRRTGVRFMGKTVHDLTSEESPTDAPLS